MVSKQLLIQTSGVKGNQSYNTNLGCMAPCRSSKRRKIEEMSGSSTVDQILKLIGTGRIDIACATDIARAVMEDGVKNERIEKLSLGNWGISQSNSERDLHTWLRNLFGLKLQPYTIDLDLKAWGVLNLEIMFKRLMSSYMVSR